MSFYKFEFITELAQSHGREFAYVDETRKVTFAELDIGTKKIAGHLKNIGIKQNDIVAMILPSYFSWYFTFSLHRMGAGVISKSKYTKFPPEATPDFLISFQFHPDIPKEKTIIIDPDLMRNVESTGPDENLTGYSGPDAMARFFATSGTTGGARYIAYEAEKLEMLAARKSPYDFVGLDHVLSLYPFGSGQNYRLALKNLVSGRTHYNLDSGNLSSLAFMRDNPIRTLSASPTQISAFLDLQKKSEIELPKLSTIIMGGSAPSEQIIARIKSQLDCRVFNSYGSTEAGLVGLREVTDGYEKAQGLELVQQDVTLQIVDERDMELPAMSVGEIRYRRNDMAMSYYKNPTATAENFKNGFFYPGDLGFIDSAGRLVIEGRSTEVINLGGVKVNPERIETTVLAQLGVIDCAAFGRLSDSGVEELCIALVVDTDFDQEIFQKAMASKIANPIRHLSLVSVIPRNENGKIQRKLL